MENNDVIELIQITDINNHFVNLNVNVNLQMILGIYCRKSKLDSVKSKSTYYDKKIINEILVENNLPSIK